ncbi:MAG: Spy/CpxP family protein refolding chaperone [Alphaproteobacteria bacterium]|nr:Spy/CpxP family protein refolding chaperone [Alphaproteobacteria bacterium]
MNSTKILSQNLKLVANFCRRNKPLVMALLVVIPTLLVSACSSDDHYSSKNMSGRVGSQLAKLHDELNITSSQTPEWERFATTVRVEAQASAERFRNLHDNSSDGQSLTAIDRMERVQNMLEADANSKRSVIAAAKSLYAVLSDSQKKTADRLMTDMHDDWASKRHFWSSEMHSPAAHQLASAY